MATSLDLPPVLPPLFDSRDSVDSLFLRPETPPSDLGSPGAVQSPTSSESSTATHFLIPTPNTDPSQPSTFSLSETQDLQSLAPEIASADISIAPDGSFVETSSGPAARELKRRYDLHLGVNKSVRSPYAITAFVNQHGKQMYRVGHRELSAPAASADPESKTSNASSSSTSARVSNHEPRSKRRSRISVHAFLPPAIFRNSQVAAGPTSPRHNPHPSQTTDTVVPPPSTGPRKLRKTRSIPDMNSTASPTETASARGHSQSVTAADIPRGYPYGGGAPQAELPSSSSEFGVIPPPRKRDLFGDVMQWSQGTGTGTNTSLSMSTHSLSSLSNGAAAPPRDSRSSSRYDLSATSSYNNRNRPIIPHPFGHGVSFDSPSRKPTPATSPDDRTTDHGPYHLPPPRFLREMQSFESGLTARQFDPPNQPDEEPETASSSNLHVLNRAVSAVRLRSSLIPTPPNGDTSEDHHVLKPHTPFNRILPLPETSLHSRYSPAVFDVLQTYRGLPLLDRLSADSESEPTIKMSLSTDETAAPRNDPRFVIWGEVHSGGGLATGDDEDSMSGYAGSSASNPRKKSGTRRNNNVNGNTKTDHTNIPTLMLPDGKPSHGSSSHIEPRGRSGSLLDNPGSLPNMVLVAATIERWIAQLTSEIDYDELLNFFLTYRTYISAVDLCHLLICRFHWALGVVIGDTTHEAANGRRLVVDSGASRDEMVRRIVRLRTFVAIRYWLLTFFSVDFVPNRELRLLVGGWLNTLIKDPILKKHSDGVSIVRKLIKVVKDCKAAHTKTSPVPTPKPAPAPIARTSSSTSSQLLGEKFAEATRKVEPDDEDSIVDLDFFPEEDILKDLPAGFQMDPVNAHLNVAYVGSSLSSAGTGPTSIPLSSLSILQHTGLVGSGSTDPDLPFVDTSATLPIHHNALSRVFVNTIGRLGRWKRVLNSRSAAARAPVGAPVDVSAFDLELNVSRDLLTVNGGVEQYLKMLEPQVAGGSTKRLGAAPPAPSSSVSTPAPAPATTTATAPPPGYFPDPAATTSPQLPAAHPIAQPEPVAVPEEKPVDAQDDDAPLRAETESISAQNDELSVPYESSPRRSVSLRSSSTDSLGEPIARTSALAPPAHWQFDVVSIDELDLSDTSSDDEQAEAPAAPPGLRKVPRRLPLRRDFEFVPRPDSVSSMGIESVASSSAVSSASISGGLGGIQQWQMNALLDSLSNDDQETGDVEAALRRLEGEINPERQMEKTNKVEGWVKNIRDRMQAGDYNDNEPRNFSDEDEESDNDDNVQSEDEDDGREDYNSSSRTSSEQHGEQRQTPLTEGSSITPMATTYPISASSGPTSPTRPDAAKPAPEDAVPLEILQSRVSTAIVNPQPHSHRPSFSSKFGMTQDPQQRLGIHRSFILSYRAETLVEHFSMIDRELFMGVKFEELVLDDWMACEEVNVLDWAQFLKDRARWKAESRHPDKTSALAAVRARFNLIANFTLSEVVLTPPSERALVVGKLIRLAWKAYCLHNFNTLVAVITGLKSDWVTRVMRRSWHKVTVWEKRMYKDLKLYISRVDDFKHIRQAVETIADVKPLDVSSHATSVTSGGVDAPKGKSEAKTPASACVPFIGIYMSQLYRHNKLPDLIDPTAPNEGVSVDPITANFDAPAHPEVFSALAPLPSSMQLEPLINVHKQRMIAGVIKSLVAGQHLASRVKFPVDKKLFQKCLRLRGLDAKTLERAVAMYE